MLKNKFKNKINIILNFIKKKKYKFFILFFTQLHRTLVIFKQLISFLVDFLNKIINYKKCIIIVFSSENKISLFNKLFNCLLIYITITIQVILFNILLIITFLLTLLINWSFVSKIFKNLIVYIKISFLEILFFIGLYYLFNIKFMFIFIILFLYFIIVLPIQDYFYLLYSNKKKITYFQLFLNHLTHQLEYYVNYLAKLKKSDKKVYKIFTNTILKKLYYYSKKIKNFN